MVWLQVLSNLVIGLAYLTISLTLYVIIRRIHELPFSWMYIAFGVFILSCGVTHFFDVVTVWHPIYWADGAVRAVTAVASLGTAVLLVPLIPKAVALADAAKAAHARGLHLETELERSKRMEAVIASEVAAQTRDMAAELLRLRAECDALRVGNAPR